MDFVSTLLVTLTEPKGFWQSILDAFKSGLGTYIAAIILVAVIIRLLFSLVDIINKKVTMRNAEINTKMQPELDAVKAKYSNDPALLQQKTNEIYKKYQFNLMGSCLPMLIMLVLQFTVFLTLWNSLQAVSNFNIAEKYQNLKNVYANVISINKDTNILKVSDFAEGDSLKVVIAQNESGEKIMELYTAKEGEEFTKIGILGFDENLGKDNQTVWELIDNYVPQTPAENQVTETEYQPNEYSEAIRKAAENAVIDNYESTQEGFLWIKNIYKPESPTSPLFTKEEIKKYLSGYYSKEEIELEKEFDYEGKIFDNVAKGLNEKNYGVNGYYILTIIAVVTSVLSLWLSNVLMRRKGQPKQKQSWAMYVFMPLVIGLFTFMYTSLFAIYLIVGQLMMLLLTPLTSFIVKKWNDSDDKRKKKKTEVVVDYRRKDI